VCDGPHRNRWGGKGPSQGVRRKQSVASRVRHTAGTIAPRASAADPCQGIGYALSPTNSTNPHKACGDGASPSHRPDRPTPTNHPPHRSHRSQRARRAHRQDRDREGGHPMTVPSTSPPHTGAASQNPYGEPGKTPLSRGVADPHEVRARSSSGEYLPARYRGALPSAGLFRGERERSRGTPLTGESTAQANAPSQNVSEASEGWDG
jgi:hypothetical protein